MMTKYQFSKTVKKFLIAVVEVAIAGVISVYGQSPWFLIIAPVIEAGRNVVMHINK